MLSPSTSTCSFVSRREHRIVQGAAKNWALGSPVREEKQQGTGWSCQQHPLGTSGGTPFQDLAAPSLGPGSLFIKPLGFCPHVLPKLELGDFRQEGAERGAGWDSSLAGRCVPPGPVSSKEDTLGATFQTCSSLSRSLEEERTESHHQKDES